MKVFILILVLLIASCDKDSKKGVIENNLIISTVDINGDPYAISKVDWWYTSTPDVQNNLECDAEVCHVWDLPQNIEGHITISGYHSVVFENDEYCAEVFSGRNDLFIDSNLQHEYIIEILYTGAVCS